MFNSCPRADLISSLLHDREVISIDEKRAIRRANVARLLDELGQTQMADLTGISPALLYQLGKGKGKSKRNVNDARARQIERALALPPGWLDVDHDQAGVGAAPKPAPEPPLPRWPFRIDFRRFASLTRDQRERIEEVVEGMVLRFEASRPAQTEKSTGRRHRMVG